MNTMIGVVEDRTTDPLKLGRCKVRIFGLHTPDKVALPTEDLPWAAIMQPITSAATSGIGLSPTGLVEGAYVVVIFTDEHKQQPIIIGSVAGIQANHVDETIIFVETNESAAKSGVVTDGAGKIIFDGSGNPVQSGEPIIQKPTEFLVPSEACYDFIRNEEAFSSITQGKNKFVKGDAFDALSESTTVYPYQDTGGTWTIGWGNTYLTDGSKVNENTRLTKGQADTLMKDIVNNTMAKAVRSALRAPVTQSMFDAMVSMAYNAGPSFKNSSIITSINTLKYEQAATQILVYKNLSGLLSGRRERERRFFSANGYPNPDMSGIQPTADEHVQTTEDATQNPVVTLRPTPASSVTETETIRTVEGFRDPNGVYPKTPNEPDTHRLSRHEKIDQTVVFSKEAARALAIPTADGDTWDQPKIPYNASYPYNHARVTESGHIQEYDDTKGSERTHNYHKAGTYDEIDVNGTKVNRIVGDSYEIFERHGKVLIRGEMDLTVMGKTTIRIENDCVLDVGGDLTMKVAGDMTTGVSGDYRINVDGFFSVDASIIDWNSGLGGDVEMSNCPDNGKVEFPELNAPSRHDSDSAQYETPEDGDPTTYNKQQAQSGVPSTTEPVLGLPGSNTEVSTPDPVVDEKEPDPIPQDCTMIPQSGAIDRSFKLGRLFKLSDLDLRNGLAQAPVVSITKSEIVCNLKTLAENILEPIKVKYPSMVITSGYRNFIPPGGATNSDHLYGAAADIVIQGYTRAQHYAAVQEIVKILPAWTQIILEYSGSSTVWIHVAFNAKRGLKMEKFTMNNSKTVAPFGQFILLS